MVIIYVGSPRSVKEKIKEDKILKVKFYKWIFGLAAILVIFLMILMVTIRIFGQTRVKLDKMRSEWLETFYAGQENLIDWNEDLVLQAKLLRYRKEFEYLVDKLKMGKKLGAGAYGIVMKAIAEDLGPEQRELEVAVKMTKTKNLAEIKAFADELKIMMHLQQVDKKSHENIINLLGSVTVNITGISF